MRSAIRVKKSSGFNQTSFNWIINLIQLVYYKPTSWANTQREHTTVHCPLSVLRVGVWWREVGRPIIPSIQSEATVDQLTVFTDPYSWFFPIELTTLLRKKNRHLPTSPETWRKSVPQEAPIAAAITCLQLRCGHGLWKHVEHCFAPSCLGEALGLPDVDGASPFFHLSMYMQYWGGEKGGFIALICPAMTSWLFLSVGRYLGESDTQKLLPHY